MRKYIVAMSVVLILTIGLTGCRKKTNEQSAGENSNIDITVEDNVIESNSNKKLNSKIYLDEVKDTEEWDCIPEDSNQQKVDNDIVEEDGQKSDEAPTENLTDSNTIPELSIVPFA